MIIQPYVTFEDKNLEQRPLAEAFNAHHILERYPDLLQRLGNLDAGDGRWPKDKEPEEIIPPVDVEKIGRIGSSLSQGGEVSPHRLYLGISALKALREACERDMKLDYGAAQFARVIIEARQEQMRKIDEALLVLKNAEKFIDRAQDDISDYSVAEARPWAKTGTD